MFRETYHSMQNLPLINDIFNNEDIQFAYEIDTNAQDLKKPDNFKLYKIPRYLEKVHFSKKIVYFRFFSSYHKLNYIQYCYRPYQTMFPHLEGYLL
jgi:hypothetical protein